LLGVAPDAPTSDIRDAYRRAARAHHPDRHGEQTSAQMVEVNRAWQVLGDPVRRREYDLSLPMPVTAPGSIADAAPSSFREPAFNPLAQYQDPPRFPWKFLGVLFLIGLAFIVLGIVTASDPVLPKVDNVLQPGDCVIIQPNGDAAESLCTEPHSGIVDVLVPTGGTCDPTTEPHRDQQGMGTACVRRG
jgi:hypothetical protein